jgi:large subunit ribosomal protein L28e
MAGVSPDLLWQLVKKNNKFLVKRNGNGSASLQFSSEPNNLYNLNSFKYSGLSRFSCILFSANS